MALPRVATGIPGFDDITGGGLLKGRTYILSGTQGSGKTILGLQYLYEGARRGEPGILIAAEQSPAQVREEASVFGWNLKVLEDQRKLVLVDASSSRAGAPTAEKAVLSDPYDFEQLIDVLIGLQEEFKTGRAVIDSITALTYNIRDTAQQRNALHKLNQALKILELTTLMTAEGNRPMTRGTGDEHFHLQGHPGPEAFITDGHIVLYHRRILDSRIHSVEVLKMRGSDHSHKVHPFSIGKSGVTINTAEGVYGEF
jgi:KaiC/GvpD/RAD55 family RecA-like ATPase